MLQVAVGALIVGTIAVVGVSHHMGNQVRTGFYRAASELYHPMLRVEVTEYKRTFLGALARTTWTVQGPKSEQMQFTMEHTISHGPWTLQDAARITTHLQLPARTDPAVRRALQDQAPAQWVAHIGWGGGSEHTLSAPAWKAQLKDGVQVDWGGLQAHWQLSQDRLAVQGEMQVPRLKMDQGEFARLGLEGFSLRYDGQQAPSHLFWTGPFQMQLQRLQMRSPLMTWQMDGVEMKSTTELQSQLVRSDLRTKVRQFELKTPAVQTARDLEFHLDMERIPAAWMDQLMRWSQSADREARMQQAAQFQASLPQLLKSQPILQLRTLRFTTNEGTSELQARLQYQGRDGQVADPMRDLQAHVQLTLPQTLLNSHLPSDKLEQLSTMGLLERHDGHYRTLLQLQQGEMLLNQRPLPLPMLLAMQGMM